MVNQSQLTAKELFFNDIEDVQCLIIMCFHLDSLITELPNILLTNTLVICPKDQRKKLIDVGIPSENIFHIPSDWHQFDVLHGKIFVKITQDTIECMIGSNNFTYAGMERNLETYSTYNVRLKNEIPFEIIKTRHHKSDWHTYFDHSIVEDIMDFINHILVGYENKDYLAEDHFLDLSKDQYFVHSVGQNTLLESIKSLMKPNEKQLIRIITPYLSGESLLFYLDLIHKNIGRGFQLQLLTNFLPDFKGFYNSSGFINPDDYKQIKQEWKQSYDVDIELRFWTSIGIEEMEIPGNFIHSKLYFVVTSDDRLSPDGFLMTSANFSSAAWKNQRTLEVGILDTNGKRIKDVFDFFNRFWEESEQDNEENLHKILNVRNRIVEDELVTQLPLKRFQSGSHRYRKHKTILTGPSKQQVHHPITISIPKSEYLDDFFQKSIDIYLPDHSPKISDVVAEINYLDVTQPGHLTLKKEIPLSNTTKNHLSLPLNDLQKFLNTNLIIDSIRIRAETDVVTYDTEIKTSNWEKVVSENIVKVENKKITFQNLDKYLVSDRESIEGLLITQTSVLRVPIEENESECFFIMPDGLNQSEISSIIIRQNSSEMSQQTLLFYQPALKFQDNPISSIEITTIEVEDIKIPCLHVIVEETFFNFDLSDFVFISNDEKLIPLIQKKEGNHQYYIFSIEKSKIRILIKNHLENYFTYTEQYVEYGLTSDHLSALEKIVNKHKQGKTLLISPEIIDEITPVSIEFSQVMNDKVELEYIILNNRLQLYKRPTRKIITEKSNTILLDSLLPGQEINSLVYYVSSFGKLTLLTFENFVKNKLIEKINVRFPFKNHMRAMANHSWVYHRHFLFSIELNLSSKYVNFIKYVTGAKIIHEQKDYEFKKIISSKISNDSFLIFFKIQNLKEEKGKIKLSFVLMTSGHFADFYYDIKIQYEKRDDGILLKIDNAERFIKDGYGAPLVDSFSVIHHSLIEKFIIKNYSNLKFNDYDIGKSKKICLDSSELIAPVWFLSH